MCVVEQDIKKKVCPDIECHRCYSKGHISRDCPDREYRAGSPYYSDEEYRGKSPSYTKSYRSGGDRSPRHHGYNSPRGGQNYGPHRGSRSPGYREKTPEYRQRSPGYRHKSPSYRGDSLGWRGERRVRIRDQ